MKEPQHEGGVVVRIIEDLDHFMDIYNICLFQVEPNTKLFPAVFCLPSSQNLLQVELGKLKVQN